MVLAHLGAEVGSAAAVMNQIIWWTGASILTTSAALGTAGLLWLLGAVASELAALSTRRLGNVATNLRDMREWVRCGKPRWDREGKPVQMRPMVTRDDEELGR